MTGLSTQARQERGHYHVSPLTRRKTRACNFNHVIFSAEGGGKEKVSVGERCLVGANAGLGIALGDDCVVEAGCYITAGSKVTLPDGTVVKALELSGRPGIQFWRNSVTGALEAVARKGAWGELNAALHVND